MPKDKTEETVEVVEQATPQFYISDGVLKMRPMRVDNILGKRSAQGKGPNRTLSWQQQSIFDVSDPDAPELFLQFGLLERGVYDDER